MVKKMINHLFILFTCVFVCIFCFTVVRIAQKVAIKANVLFAEVFYMSNLGLRFGYRKD